MSVKNSTFLDLKNLTFALIGREYLSATAQFARLVALWNQGAKKAYRASNYWDRHLVVGEPRTVVQGYVASSEDGLDNIDTFLRIYKQQPFKGSAVQECDFYVRNGRAYVQGTSANQDTVYVTYKNEYTPAYTIESGDGDEVPDEYMNYMAHYAAYTWQRSVEQNSSENNFALSLGLINQVLEDELAKLEGQGIFNSNVARKFKTYRNSN